MHARRNLTSQIEEADDILRCVLVEGEPSFADISPTDASPAPCEHPSPASLAWPMPHRAELSQEVWPVDGPAAGGQRILVRTSGGTSQRTLSVTVSFGAHGWKLGSVLHLAAFNTTRIGPHLVSAVLPAVPQQLALPRTARIYIDSGLLARLDALPRSDGTSFTYWAPSEPHQRRRCAATGSIVCARRPPWRGLQRVDQQRFSARIQEKCAQPVVLAAHEPAEWDTCGLTKAKCLDRLRRTSTAPGFSEFEGDASRHGAAGAISARTVDLVLATYATPLRLLRGMLQSVATVLTSERVRPSLWVYDKGGRTESEMRRAIGRAVGRMTMHLRLGLPNVGRCDHSFLLHIAERYHDLADASVFVKETLVTHAHLGYAPKLLTYLRRLPAAPHAWCARGHALERPRFGLRDYRSELCRNLGRTAAGAAPAGSSSPAADARRSATGASVAGGVNGGPCYGSDFASFVRAAVRPLGRWLAHHGLLLRTNGTPSAAVRGVPYCPGGVFAASAAAVRSTPLPTYAGLLAELAAAGPNSEAGHYMERSWMRLMGAGLTTDGQAGSRPGAADAREDDEGGGGDDGGMRAWRSSLAIHAVHCPARRATPKGRSALAEVMPSPCNASALQAAAGTEEIHLLPRRARQRSGVARCLFFARSPTVLAAARAAGWETRRLSGVGSNAGARAPCAAEWAEQVRAALQDFDYTVLVPTSVWTAGGAINLPALLELIGTDGWDPEGAAVRAGDGELMLRRRAVLVRAAGATSAKSAGRPRAMPTVQSTTPLLLGTTAELAAWWRWWGCRRATYTMGHDVSVRLSARDAGRRCCKPL